MVLETVKELVVVTDDEETPQLPRDLNTTNDIITDTLDLLFTDLDSTAVRNQTNLTVADVSRGSKPCASNFFMELFTVPCFTCFRYPSYYLFSDILIFI